MENKFPYLFIAFAICFYDKPMEQSYFLERIDDTRCDVQVTDFDAKIG